MLESVARDHDALVARLRAVASRLTPRAVGSAFVASFDRAAGAAVGGGALMNYAQVAHMPAHVHHGIAQRPDLCVDCGFDVNAVIDVAESAADAAEGDGVPGSLGQPFDLLLRLEVLERALPLEPTRAACDAFARLFAMIAALPATAAEGQLRQALGKAKILANQRERASAIESLGIAGVLATVEHRGFFGRHVDLWTRQQRPSARVETDPPICFWRARDGVCRDAFMHWFGHLDLSAKLRTPAPRPEAARRSAKATPASEIEVGDTLAFALPDGRWRAAIVVRLMPSKTAGPGPVVVFLRKVFTELPPLAALADTPVVPGRFCLYGLRKRADRKNDPRYVYLGASRRGGLDGSGAVITRLTAIEGVLDRLG